MLINDLHTVKLLKDKNRILPQYLFIIFENTSNRFGNLVEFPLAKTIAHSNFS